MRCCLMRSVCQTRRKRKNRNAIPFQNSPLATIRTSRKAACRFDRRRYQGRAKGPICIAWSMSVGERYEMNRPELPVTYSPAEVAEYFGVTRRTIYEWLLSGALKADKAGPRRWVITRDSIDSFINASARKETPALAPKPEPVQHTLPPEMLPIGSGRVMPATREPAGPRPKPNKRRK